MSRSTPGSILLMLARSALRERAARAPHPWRPDRRLGVVLVTAGLAACPGDGGSGSGGTVRYTDFCYVVGEGADTAYVAVERTDGGGSEARASYSTSPVTATPGADYSAVTGTLVWPAGDTSVKFIEIPVHGDSTTETNGQGEERLTVHLRGVGDTTVLPNTNTMLAIVDDDDASRGAVTLADPVNQLNATNCHVAGSAVTFWPVASSVDESVGAVDITLLLEPESRSGLAPTTVEMHIGAAGSATSGADYESFAHPVLWGSGEAGEQVRPLEVIDDAASEGTETVQVGLVMNVNGATLVVPSGVAFDIIDND